MSTNANENENKNKKTLTAEPFVNCKTAAKFLGLPENTLYKFALARTVPSFKTGKLRRFRLSELQAWMESNRVEAGE